MGGFRSQPDLSKHTIAKESLGLTYAVSSMCGSFYFNQVGVSTWKMRTLLPCFLIERVIFLGFLMVMEVSSVVMKVPR